MTKAQAVAEYVEGLGLGDVEDIKNEIKHGRADKVAIRCGFLDYVDALAKDNQITEKQRNTWTAPEWLY